MSLTTEHLVGGRKTFNGLFGTKKLNLNALLFMFVMYSPWSLFAKSVSGPILQIFEIQASCFDFMKS